MNGKQIISIFIVVLGVLMVSTAQLTDLFGAHVAKGIVSVAALVNSILGGIMGVITGQASMIKEVAAMPGIEPIKVNAQANQTLATIATDPTQMKIEPLAKDEAKVNDIAAGGVS